MTVTANMHGATKARANHCEGRTAWLTFETANGDQFTIFMPLAQAEAVAAAFMAHVSWMWFRGGDEMTGADLEKLLADATPGEWSLHGPVYNRTVGADEVNRICFLAHGNGLNDDRDIANARLIALAPTLARRVIAAEKLAEALRDAVAGVDGASMDLLAAWLRTKDALATWEAAQ